MPSGSIHTFLTRQMLDALPSDQRALIGAEEERLCSSYCHYPDVYYGDPEKVRPYLCFIDEIPFHYIPNEPVEYNNWQMEEAANGPKLVALPLPENVHHRHCRIGFAFYFERIARALSEGRSEDAAKFIGALCHVLQDATVPFHALEGSDGVDIFVLDRLIAPPPNRPHLTPSILFLSEECLLPPESGAYSPRLLGTTPAEASFHAYTGFCRAVAENRLHILPLVAALYAGDRETADSHWRAVYRSTLDLLADFLHTAFSMASGQFEISGRQALQRTPLEKVRAARRPRHLSKPYRFTPFIDGRSLDAHRASVPLALLWNGEERRYEHGIGMGAHAWFAFDYELPAGVFDRLTGSLGLHAALGIDGHVQMRWLRNGVSCWDREFSKDFMAASFDLDVRAGGLWTLEGKSLIEPLSEKNQLVIAEPVLSRIRENVS